MKIQHNLLAMNANRNIKINTGTSAKTTEKLSSGYKINRAADDAAGLSISEKMRRLIRGLTQASQNCQDGISMVQTAEGALNEVHDMLQRMNELAVQSANGTNAEADRQALQQEFVQIQDEIDRVSQTTTFNAMRLFADGESVTNTSGSAGGTSGSTGTLIGGTIGQGSMAIFIKNLSSGKHTEFKVDSTSTVGELKAMIASQMGTSQDELALVFAGNTLEDNKTFADYSIQKDSTLHLTTATTPSVTNLDGADDTNSVMRTMSLQSSARAAGVQCGDFTVTGGTEGVDFSYADGTLTVLSGTNLTITGTGVATTDKIVIQDGITANVTLNNVNIDVSSQERTCALKVDGNATLNLTLAGANTLKSGFVRAGLEVNDGATLTIEGTGSLNANGGNEGAGIGGGDYNDAGSIEIKSGTITATGVFWGAGIGGAATRAGGDIKISGGTVTATGGNCGAGIGGGVEGGCGTIAISGGTVHATGTGGGAGIGSGYADNPNGGLMGFGTGAGGDIKISGGTVYATGTGGGAGIGSGCYSWGVDVEISGGQITAIGGAVDADNCAVAIGDGVHGSGSTFTTGTGGSAVMTLSNENGDTEIGKLITDSDDTSAWDATINGVVYGNPIQQGTGTIDLSTLTGQLEITDTGYKIGSQEYVYTGTYTFSGTTTQNIVVSSNANITLNNVTGANFTVTNNSKANVTLNGTNTMNKVKVENGSEMNTTGSGTLVLANGMTNGGIVTIGSGTTLENNGSSLNSGTIQNNGNLKNNDTLYNSGGTLDNNGTIDNNGHLKSDGTVDNTGGTVNNNTGAKIENDGTFDNTSGTIIDNGGIVMGTITGNQPTEGGGTGGGSGSGGTGGGTGGGSGTGGTGGATTDEAKNSWWIQAGAEAGQGINIEIGAMDTKVLGIEKNTVNILTQESSGNAITAVSGAIEKLSAQRSRLGAYQNRLEHTIRNLDNVVENTTAAESRIRDADMAELMVEHSNNNIIMQAAQAMLAQANQQPEGVLQLLQ